MHALLYKDFRVMWKQMKAFLFRHCTMKRPLYQQTPAEESVDSGVLARGGQVWYTA